MGDKEIRHVAIILDGNRRFAKKLRLPQMEGHRKGLNRFKEVYQKFKEEGDKYGVKELSLYCFSMQNFNRSEQEVDYLMDIFEETFNDSANDENIHKNRVRLNVVGRTHLLPEKVQKAIKKAMDATKDYNDYTINFCLAYGGKEEITDAAKRLAKDVKEGKIEPEDVDEEVFGKYLYFDSDIDIAIRTGGELRTSNFLPWQTSYAEWFFVNKMWPEFGIKDFRKILKDFKKRNRRFGRD
jgi:tritrans,polycis-undecaprenyl-diphosphate synthase [geranylgeranyl-diphosphate specific]